MSAPRGFALAQCDLVSFDRAYAARCPVQQPDRYRLLDALPEGQVRIARGAGVSYVAASFGADAVSLDMRAFDRILAFDDTRGLITVEAGISVGAVVRFGLARGWCLAVVPGHPRATIGGCIAADVHGKNPARDGTFRRHVQAITLLDPTAGWVAASRQEHVERFDASHAGFGIPGLILNATLQFVRAPTAYAIRRIPVRNLHEAHAELVAHAGAPLLYGWHDGRAGRLGRGVIRFGLEAQTAAPGRAPRTADLPAQVTPWPVRTWNPLGIAAMNTWIQRRWCRPGNATVGVEAALFPLNDARAYYAGFGRAGFAESQWLVPHATYETFVDELDGLIARLRPRIGLIASKLFDGTPDGFGFDGQGVAFAIQLADPRAVPQRTFIEALNELALRCVARPNLIKDSTLDAATVRRAFRDFDVARARLRAFDPKGLQRSELTRRLEL